MRYVVLLSVVLVLMLLPISVRGEENDPLEPFGLTTIPTASNEGEIFAQRWKDTRRKFLSHVRIVALCRQSPQLCAPSVKRFLSVQDVVALESGFSRIQAAHVLVNSAISFVDDRAQWGEPDRWSLPFETFATGKGDCEDYAIAKYLILAGAGVPLSELRLVVVKILPKDQEEEYDQLHAVLGVRLKNKWFILDVNNSDVLEDKDIRTLKPMFVLDKKGVRAFGSPTMASR